MPEPSPASGPPLYPSAVLNPVSSYRNTAALPLSRVPSAIAGSTQLSSFSARYPTPDCPLASGPPRYSSVVLSPETFYGPIAALPGPRPSSTGAGSSLLPVAYPVAELRRFAIDSPVKRLVARSETESSAHAFGRQSLATASGGPSASGSGSDSAALNEHEYEHDMTSLIECLLPAGYFSSAVLRSLATVHWGVSAISSDKKRKCVAELKADFVAHQLPSLNPNFSAVLLSCGFDWALLDVLLSPSEARKILRTLSWDKIEAIAHPIQYLAKTNVVFAANKSGSLAIDGKPLGYVVTLAPRSTWAFNNGPAGNFAVLGWKHGDRLVKAIEVAPRPGQQVEYTWVKTTRHKKDITCEWRVQIGFLYPCLAEYAVSGRPVAWDTAVDIHSALDKRFEMFASTLEEVVKKKSTNGPSSSMFLAPRRPVFIANATAMDEGHLSEFDDVYGLLVLVNDPDVRFNRVPEVLVFNATKKEYFPMSFHLLHRLGTGVVLNVTIASMAYEHSRKLGWEYRLINITVVGCREDDVLSSPSKYVVKRKAVILDLDDSSDETPVSKKIATGSKTGEGKDAAAGGGKGSGAGESSST
ncbi:hypothetical protein DFH08DRAFT_969020 [Mycena albidolilacea]|uniref:Uncharacterized protein n=1 Tax=Mycena albidolilacea TaxID=1033008 RepID=A0AAD6ZIY3_9AGAR|nr:hypothetical protein DFH08DRAFT_969020 [Mycena albidolilacea]